MSFAIHEVPPPTAGHTSGLLLALVDVDARLGHEVYGHDDFHNDLAAWRTSLTPTAYQVSRAWLALPAGVPPQRCRPSDAIGALVLELPLQEDTNCARFELGVTTAHRGRGIGSALLATMEGAIEGRPTRQTWMVHPEVPASDDRALTAASGSGTIDVTSPGARWLSRRGFTLEMVERHSVLTVTADVIHNAAAHARASAAVAGSGYEAVTWVGATPGGLLGDVADMMRQFTRDVPSAGLDSDEQAWDAARVAFADERTAQRGHGQVRTAIRHRASGRLVGLTELSWPGYHPSGVWQNVTLVNPDHRGHRLGLWLKCANLQRLPGANPNAARVHTWNALENSHMLAINAALGFVDVGLECAWQRRR